MIDKKHNWEGGREGGRKGGREGGVLPTCVMCYGQWRLWVGARWVGVTRRSIRRVSSRERRVHSAGLVSASWVVSDGWRIEIGTTWRIDTGTG